MAAVLAESPVGVASSAIGRFEVGYVTEDGAEHRVRLDEAWLVPLERALPVRNGQTTGTAVAGPLSAGSFSCPSGQLRFLDAVSYSNTVIMDQFGNSLHATPDPISATLHIQV